MCSSAYTGNVWKNRNKTAGGTLGIFTKSYICAVCNFYTKQELLVEKKEIKLRKQNISLNLLVLSITNFSHILISKTHRDTRGMPLTLSVMME